MELYPAIDLRAGRCVRLWQGDFGKETVYGTDPVAVAERFVDAGARWLHVVDLDAARGQGSNRDTVVAIAGSVAAHVQASGGVRDGRLGERPDLRATRARSLPGWCTWSKPERSACRARAS